MGLLITGFEMCPRYGCRLDRVLNAGFSLRFAGFARGTIAVLVMINMVVGAMRLSVVLIMRVRIVMTFVVLMVGTIFAMLDIVRKAVTGLDRFVAIVGLHCL